MATEGVLGRSLGLPERQGAIMGRGHEERSWTTKRASFPVSVPRQEDTAYQSSRGGRESLL